MRINRSSSITICPIGLWFLRKKLELLKWFSLVIKRVGTVHPSLFTVYTRSVGDCDERLWKPQVVHRCRQRVGGSLTFMIIIIPVIVIIVVYYYIISRVKSPRLWIILIEEKKIVVLWTIAIAVLSQKKKTEQNRSSKQLSQLIVDDQSR